MKHSQAKLIVEEHRAWAFNNLNRNPKTRIAALNTLEMALKLNREQLLSALADDLGKPSMESYSSELSLIIHEIRYAKKQLKKWIKPKHTGIINRGLIVREPFGAALIIGPWNYPAQLTLVPLVSALAAGNGVTVKPSELAPKTAEVICSMLQEAFEPKMVKVVLGDAETAKVLLNSGYDKIFFTGSPKVGALVAEQAARSHSDVTLELGGKSPVIIDEDSNIEFAAKRIAWGKFLNAGQTCIAPDYILIHENIKENFLNTLKETLVEFFGQDPKSSPDYGRIVNQKHFDRLTDMINEVSTIYGGQSDRNILFIEPTIMTANMDSLSMKEEIFGPVLPILSWKSFDEIKKIISVNSNPLAVYCFSNDKQFQKRIITEIPFGGGAINDTILQISDPNLPFGGRGTSGRGNYHGKWGFETFTHTKGIKLAKQGKVSSTRFPPYKPIPEKIRRILFGI
ncbi:MAG: aldehyde dehydrogenase family protein [Spirochaetales bacterium]|nr:aldehyde dehydrogenase family protein [Spirochaetales bacterium]